MPTLEGDHDLVIVGAGPVGLALAIAAARELRVLVVDRRPPPCADAGLRPQLLVARSGDLWNLRELGVDVDDPRLVSLLATRCEADLGAGVVERRDVLGRHVPPVRAASLWALAAQPPLALVPIGRLQEALLARAEAAGVRVVFGCDVRRVRRHAGDASLACARGAFARAAMAVIATGTGRSALSPARVDESPVVRMVGGLFAAHGARAAWHRVELPRGEGTLRTTMLQTSADTGGGTALLVQPHDVADDLLADDLLEAYDQAAIAHGLAGAPHLVPPVVFATSVAAVPRRTYAGDGRAPLVIAGDAAQTGHVFSGQTCFVNVALVLDLAARLRDVRRALVGRALHAPELLAALAAYQNQSEIGAAILAHASRRHYQPPERSWALAGVARA